jgi:hypothetical protein
MAQLLGVFPFNRKQHGIRITGNPQRENICPFNMNIRKIMQKYEVAETTARNLQRKGWCQKITLANLDTV